MKKVMKKLGGVTLPLYIAKVPISYEYVGEYDSFDSSTNAEYKLDYTFEIKKMTCQIKYEENDKPKQFIQIDGIVANSQIEAFSIACSVFSIISSMGSLQLQRRNVNQHYGHIRLKWYKRNVSILPNDHSPSVSSFSKTSIKGNLNGLEDLLLKIWGDTDKTQELKFLVNAYYGALQAQDHKAKYYHAFTIIENLESRNKNVGTKKFLKKDCKDAAALVEQLFLSNGYLKEDVTLAVGTVSGQLGQITNESRAEKLYKILHDIFGIVEIDYFDKVKIDKPKAQEFIKIRNALFHGGNPPNFKQNMDQLIIVCEKILWKLLEA